MHDVDAYREGVPHKSPIGSISPPNPFYLRCTHIGLVVELGVRALRLLDAFLHQPYLDAFEVIQKSFDPPKSSGYGLAYFPAQLLLTSEGLGVVLKVAHSFITRPQSWQSVLSTHFIIHHTLQRFTMPKSTNSDESDLEDRNKDERYSRLSSIVDQGLRSLAPKAGSLMYQAS